MKTLAVYAQVDRFLEQELIFYRLSYLFICLFFTAAGSFLGEGLEFYVASQ